MSVAGRVSRAFEIDISRTLSNGTGAAETRLKRMRWLNLATLWHIHVLHCVWASQNEYLEHLLLKLIFQGQCQTERVQQKQGWKEWGDEICLTQISCQSDIRRIIYKIIWLLIKMTSTLERLEMWPKLATLWQIHVLQCVWACKMNISNVFLKNSVKRNGCTGCTDITHQLSSRKRFSMDTRVASIIVTTL